MISIGIFLLFVRFFKVSFAFGLIGLLVGIVGYQIVTANLLELIVYFGLEEYLRVDTIEAGSGRLVAWQFAWQSIQDNFLFGRGFSYDLKLMRDNFDWLSRAGHEGGVHNSYLILWLNTGLIGVIFYFRALLLIFLRSAKHSALAVPAMVAILFSVSFEPWLAASLNPYTIVFLLILTMISSSEINVPVTDDEEPDPDPEEISPTGDIKLQQI